jgi:hypothetical protein
MMHPLSHSKLLQNERRCGRERQDDKALVLTTRQKKCVPRTQERVLVCTIDEKSIDFPLW